MATDSVSNCLETIEIENKGVKVCLNMQIS